VLWVFVRHGVDLSNALAKPLSPRLETVAELKRGALAFQGRPHSFQLFL
jgi:hypothetical protein